MIAFFSLTKFLIISLAWINSQVNAVVYRDFKEFEGTESLDYGILFVGPDVKLLTSAEDGTAGSLFKSKSYYVDVVNRSSSWKELNETTQFCQNLPSYLIKGKLLLEVENKDLEEIAFVEECLRGSSDLTDFGIIIQDQETLQPLTLPTVKMLQSHGTRFGLKANSGDVFSFKVQQKLLQYLNAGVTVDIVEVMFPLSKKSYYDYDAFAEHLNEEYARILQAIPGFHPQVILNLVWFGESPEKSESVRGYISLVSKFLYRWGEEKKVSVLFGHPYCNSADGNDLSISCATRIFADHKSGKLTFSLSTRNENFIESAGEMITSTFLCTDFNSIILEVPADHELPFEKLMDLAAVHSNLPCEFSWDALVHLGGAKEKLDRNIEHISNLKKTYPNLMRNIAISISMTDWETEDESESALSKKVNETMQQFQSISTTLNLSTSPLLVDSDINIISLIERMTPAITYFNQFLNITLGIDGDVEAGKITPAYLNELSEKIEKNGKKPVFVNIDWKTHNKGEFGGCYDFKKQMNVIKNWAEVHSYNLVVLERLSNVPFSSSSDYALKPWMKDVKVFGDGYTLLNATKEEAKVLSNFRDTCVAMPKNTPVTPVNFSEIHSGVTFSLTPEKYSSFSAKDLAVLLKLIHSKFNAIEVVVEDFQSVGVFNDATHFVKKGTDETDFAKYKYFLNVAYEHLPSIKTDPNIYGIYSNLCFCENDLGILEGLRKVSSHSKLGVNLRLNEIINLVENDSRKELLSSVDYVVIRVDLPYGTKMTDTFSHYVTYGAYDIQPNPVFDNLRVSRLYLRRLNPNVTVYMQIAWPTISNNKRSIERARKLWEFLNDFSREFDIPFFLHEAFDENATTSELQYGWWRMVKDSDVGNPFNCIDKQDEFYNFASQKKLVENLRFYQKYYSRGPLIDPIISTDLLHERLKGGYRTRTVS